MLNWLNGIWDSICSWTAGTVGSGVAITGVVIRELAIIGIMLGILLWMFKCTKPFRWSLVTYGIGFILEILGILIGK